jgi:hypothetical protein
MADVNKPQKPVNPKTEVGYYGTNTRYGFLRSDEFLRELKGVNGIKKFREMRDNDDTTGAALYAIEQTLKDVGYKVEPSDDDTTGEYAEFVQEVLNDMDHSMDDHISQALSYLTFGFASFEVVYKRRREQNSMYPDGKMGVKKLASRAQWTINKFEVDEDTGELEYVQQMLGKPGYNGFIPKNKLVHYTTTTVNGDWTGRSVLRNAYKSYYYLSKIQEYEAIAIEREMHGIPVGRIPSEYLSPNASDDQKLLLQQFTEGLTDLKNNEQGAIVIASDVYVNEDGKNTNTPLMSVDLLSASGSRSIDMNEIITRYQNNIARTLMAEFLMLGGGSGSYALSKTKGDMFLRSLESYLHNMYGQLQRQLLPRLFELNGFDKKYIPTLKPKDVAPYDLKEIAAFLRNVNGAGVDIASHQETLDFLFNEAAEIPYDATKNTSTAEAQHARDMELAEAMPETEDQAPEEEE